MAHYTPLRPKLRTSGSRRSDDDTSTEIVGEQVCKGINWQETYGLHDGRNNPASKERYHGDKDPNGNYDEDGEKGEGNSHESAREHHATFENADEDPPRHHQIRDTPWQAKEEHHGCVARPPRSRAVDSIAGNGVDDAMDICKEGMTRVSHEMCDK